MQYIIDNWETIGAIALQVVGVAALVDTLTPTESDNKIVAMLQKIIHTLGANIGKAKNQKK